MSQRYILREQIPEKPKIDVLESIRRDYQLGKIKTKNMIIRNATRVARKNNMNVPKGTIETNEYEENIKKRRMQ